MTSRNVSGTAVSISQAVSAGVASTFPAASIARTRNVCAPSESPANVAGEVHGAKAPVSTEHSNVAVASFEENVKTAFASLETASGSVTIVVSGAAVSTVHANVAGVGSAFPAASTARTANVCGPSARPGAVNGLVQTANAAESREHSKIAAGSSLSKSKVATAVSDGSDGVVSNVVSGAPVSTVHV